MHNDERIPGKDTVVRARTKLVTVRDCCWLCAGVLTTEISYEGAPRPHLQWFCESCQVSWSGPGSTV